LKDAEFSEREYEGFLYNQLQAGDRRLWHPHEVLEHYLGFDRGLFVADLYLWRMKGRRSAAGGFAPWQFYGLWPELVSHRIPRSRLPKFHLNCFIQAKRPQFARRVPQAARGLSWKRPIFRFEIDQAQHDTLDRVARAMARRALFVYAAPAFHTSSELFAVGRRGTTVENSTFPAVQDITGHTRWYYNEPGTVGVRNPDDEPIELPSLQARLGELVELRDDSESASAGLQELASALRASVLEETQAGEARTAYLADEWRSIDVYSDRVEAPAAVRHFLAVDAFCDYFNLAWLTVGRGTV